MSYLQRTQGTRIGLARSLKNRRAAQRANQQLQDAAELLKFVRRQLQWQSNQIEKKDAEIWRLQKLLMEKQGVLGSQ